MSDRAVVRVFATVVVTALVVIVGVYVLNPLRTASDDPRLRVVGYTVVRFPTRSMQPAIHLNDILVVSAWPYRNADPAPGDIVVFQYPLDRSVLFAKRVIAAGGSMVEIRDATTFIDGKRIDEPYVDPKNNIKDISRRAYSARVPGRAYFVMGDNRDDSDDSRHWGFLPRNYIVGKVISVSTPDSH